MSNDTSSKIALNCFIKIITFTGKSIKIVFSHNVKILKLHNSINFFDKSDFQCCDVWKGEFWWSDHTEDTLSRVNISPF